MNSLSLSLSLSYDQEELIRLPRRKTSSNQNTSLHRHEAAALQHIFMSSHDAIRGAAEHSKKTGKNLMDVGCSYITTKDQIGCMEEEGG